MAPLRVTEMYDVIDIPNLMLEDGAFYGASRGGGHNFREEPPRHASISERDELAQELSLIALGSCDDGRQ